jgi:hypothetical protein
MATFTFKLMKSYDIHNLPLNSKQVALNKKRCLVVKNDCITQDDNFSYYHVYDYDNETSKYKLRNKKMYTINELRLPAPKISKKKQKISERKLKKCS